MTRVSSGSGGVVRFAELQLSFAKLLADFARAESTQALSATRGGRKPCGHMDGVAVVVELRAASWAAGLAWSSWWKELPSTCERIP
eukprot:CAMPEP_0178383504 /NCGR_PEP_ID=MMETSP0689_2-20121128/7035_1 /TAXON_ID=160604 /ORGANISM="Amphidinium massartii, Strain CS-259" /LENGTH=85 /DNA_ID=CAMNT_0020003725 /DNA_START=236 /DNA_END=490 /DNA_ORIENTATION=-